MSVSRSTARGAPSKRAANNLCVIGPPGRIGVPARNTRNSPSISNRIDGPPGPLESLSRPLAAAASLDTAPRGTASCVPRRRQGRREPDSARTAGLPPSARVSLGRTTTRRHPRAYARREHLYSHEQKDEELLTDRRTLVPVVI